MIALDGDYSNRAYTFIQPFGPATIIENINKKNVKNIIITQDLIKYDNEIMGKIKEDKKIIICCMSARDATDYHDEIKKIYPEKQVFVYTGETDDEIKEDHFKNITLQWQTADVVLYSPTIESGVNFDIEHFHSVYGIFSTGSTSQRAFFKC